MLTVLGSDMGKDEGGNRRRDAGGGVGWKIIGSQARTSFLIRRATRPAAS
jgi:hypothetical protein